MENRVNRVEKAVNLFMEGYNCSQSIFTAYSDLYGLDMETSLKLSSGLGAGVGRTRQVCGAITGATMIISLEYSNGSLANAQNKSLVYKKVQEMISIFNEKHSTIICKELLGNIANKTSPVPDERTKEYYQKRPCVQVVYDAAQALEAVLN